MITPKEINALKLEIKILKAANHSRIIKFIGSEMNKNSFYIYMENASEGTLMKLYSRLT